MLVSLLNADLIIRRLWLNLVIEDFAGSPVESWYVQNLHVTFHFSWEADGAKY